MAVCKILLESRFLKKLELDAILNKMLLSCVAPEERKEVSKVITNERFYYIEPYFSVPYTNRFSEGKFRKRVQFMYGGKLQQVHFSYCGPSVEAVLDRLPTAEIISEQDGVYEIRAEVFGKGIEMWLRSQGDYIK